MSNRFLVVGSAGALVAAGCATVPPGPTLDRSGERVVFVEDRSGNMVRTPLQSDDQTRTAELGIGFAAAWARLPGILEELGLPIGSIDETRGLIAHDGARLSRIDGRRMSAFLDCGSGTTAQPYADLYSVTAGYEVLIVSGESDGRSRAEMRIDATARARDVRGNPLRCRSKGRLEQLVFERLDTGGEGGV